jgi:hypothetical protein
VPRARARRHARHDGLAGGVDAARAGRDRHIASRLPTARIVSPSITTVPFSMTSCAFSASRIVTMRALVKATTSRGVSTGGQAQLHAFRRLAGFGSSFGAPGQEGEQRPSGAAEVLVAEHPVQRCESRRPVQVGAGIAADAGDRDRAGVLADSSMLPPVAGSGAT